jgi:hypothetical protein
MNDALIIAGKAFRSRLIVAPGNIAASRKWLARMKPQARIWSLLPCAV